LQPFQNEQLVEVHARLSQYVLQQQFSTLRQLFSLMLSPNNLELFVDLVELANHRNVYQHIQHLGLLSLNVLIQVH
jgi:hypothetical protein